MNWPPFRFAACRFSFWSRVICTSGAPLFHRRKRGIDLTHAGIAYRDACQSLLDRHRQQPDGGHGCISLINPIRPLPGDAAYSTVSRFLVALIMLI